MKRKGFTLIELMIVVAIIGILASVAVPSFLKFMKQSKVSEVHLNIKALVNGSVAWWNEEHADSNGNPIDKHFPWESSPAAPDPMFFVSMYPTAPSAEPCGSMSVGAMYPKNSTIWNTQPWISLKFSINKAHYYQYRYESYGVGTNASFSAYGIGDLDCDSTQASFLVSGAPDFSVGGHEIQVSEMKVYGPFYMPGDALE